MMIVSVSVAVVVTMLSLVALFIVEQILLDFFIFNLLLIMVVMVMVIMAVAVSVSVSMRMVMIVVMMSMVVIVFVLTAQVVMAITRMQDLHLNQVEDQAHDSNDKHDVSLDLRRHEEALGCFNK